MEKDKSKVEKSQRVQACISTLFTSWQQRETASDDGGEQNQGEDVRQTVENNPGSSLLMEVGSGNRAALHSSADITQDKKGRLLPHLSELQLKFFALPISAACSA